MKPPQWLGAAILTGVLAIALLSTIRDSEPSLDVVSAHGHVGNLKVPYFNDPRVKEILREKYGLELTVHGSGTTQLLCPDDPNDLHDADFLFAGEQSQVVIYEECQQREDPHRNVFLSPMVIYSWTDSIDALMDIGVASVDSEGVYHVDMAKLLALMESPLTWSDIGVPGNTNRVKTYATDPDLSSGGRSFAGLLANIMNCGEVVDDSTVETVLPSIHDYFKGLGHLEQSSEALFRSYLTLGQGARPLAALLESQIADFLIANPGSSAQVAQEVRMLYPTPTVWMSHPVIARTEVGERVMQALLDPELQRLGWEITGFRPAVPGVGVNVGSAQIPGISPEIGSVIDHPADDIMEQIRLATKTDPGRGQSRRICPGVATFTVPPAASPSS